MITNKAKRIATGVAMVTPMVVTAYINVDAYTLIMMCIGGYYTGTNLAAWASKRWPG